MQESRSWNNILIFPHSVITFNIYCVQALPQLTIRMLDTFPPAMHMTTSTRSSQGLSILGSLPSRTMLSRRLWSIFAPTSTMHPLIGLSKNGQASAEGTVSAMRGTPAPTTTWASNWIGGTSRNNALPRLRSAPSWERCGNLSSTWAWSIDPSSRPLATLTTSRSLCRPVKRSSTCCRTVTPRQ